MVSVPHSVDPIVAMQVSDTCHYHFHIATGQPFDRRHISNPPKEGLDSALRRDPERLISMMARFKNLVNEWRSDPI